MKITIAMLILLANTAAFAMNSSSCSSMLNEGLYKKYKWRGIGEANTNAITGETKSAGTTKGSSHISSESSTASVDPKYTTNVTISDAQMTSSWGPCSPFALQERKEQRELYVQQNLDQIKKDVANGAGEHMKTLAWFALCDDDATQEYFQTLQRGFEKLNATTDTAFMRQADELLASNKSLAGKCFNLTAM